MLVLGLAAAVAIATQEPAPAPTPLKTIITVHSRALCSTLTARVAPAINGLIIDDDLITQGQNAIAKMGADATAHASLKIDALGIEDLASAMVHNIEAIDGVLNDPAAFPLDPKTEDDKTAVAAKAKLLGVLGRQQAAMNALYGTLETLGLGDMIGDSPFRWKDGLSATSGATESDNDALEAAGIANDKHEIDTRMLDSDLLGMTPYGRIATALRGFDRQTSVYEDDLAQDVKQIAAQCGAMTKP